MKTYALAIASSTILLSTPSFAATETYHFDPTHTNIIWHADHFGFSMPSGRFGIKSGTIKLDTDKPADAKVDVEIDVTHLTTGIEKFDSHLKSDDFLHVSKYPTARFVSTKVEVTSEEKAKVSGDFTLHGVTKPIEMDVTLNKIGMHPYSKKKTVGFSGKTTIRRSEFGISRYSPNIGEEVSISIEAEASVGGK